MGNNEVRPEEEEEEKSCKDLRNNCTISKNDELTVHLKEELQ